MRYVVPQVSTNYNSRIENGIVGFACFMSLFVLQVLRGRDESTGRVYYREESTLHGEVPGSRCQGLGVYERGDDKRESCYPLVRITSGFRVQGAGFRMQGAGVTPRRVLSSSNSERILTSSCGDVDMNHSHTYLET